MGQLRAPEPDPDYDLTGDGQVDDGDRDEMVFGVLQTTYGDTDLNGIFNSEDFIRVFVIGQYEDEIPGNSSWSSGDWNADGDFTTDDVVLSFQAGGYVAEARGVDPDVAAALAAELAGSSARSTALLAPAGRRVSAVASAPCDRPWSRSSWPRVRNCSARYAEPHDDSLATSAIETEDIALAQWGL